MKRILDVGNCGPDHGSLKRFFAELCDCQVDQADQASDALAKLGNAEFRYDLVVVNRKLDIDYSDGIQIIRQIKDDPRYAATPVMLITNYPEHQQAAVECGAAPGFGKLQLQDQQVRQRVKQILCPGE